MTQEGSDKAVAESAIVQEIRQLAAERKAVILAHNYTRAEVQDIADYVGDSLELSRKAAACEAPVIVFCGVRFMAETAKILSPGAVVLHPRPDAGCPMADMATPEAVAEYRKAHPDALVVAYVNTTAATKTQVDICCTSGNAEALVGGLPQDREIVFLPDANLGANVAATLGRKISLWPGFCPTHNRIHPRQIEAARAAHPGAEVLVHPECLPAVVAVADHALSTGGMLRYVREATAKEFIVGTECGLLHRLRQENPDKTFYPLEPEVLCPNMKKITLEDVRDALRDMAPRIELDEETIRRARAPIDKMLAVRA
jgi:quinolinate synthase